MCKQEVTQVNITLYSEKRFIKAGLLFIFRKSGLLKQGFYLYSEKRLIKAGLLFIFRKEVYQSKAFIRISMVHEYIVGAVAGPILRSFDERLNQGPGKPKFFHSHSVVQSKSLK